MSVFEHLIAEGGLREHVALGPMTTYKSGGPARYFAEIPDRESLNAVISSGLPVDMPTLILGRGSNLLVSDAGFDGLVIHLVGEFQQISLGPSGVVAGGAASLPRVARFCVEAGLTGLEFFVGVPGTVGGAVRQNAGCFGAETKDVLYSASVVNVETGERRTLDSKGLNHSYRHSNLRSADLVVDATFSAVDGDADWGQSEIRRITRGRKEHQPGGTFNAGSVFKNPTDISAGALIDSLGLKGLAVGDVTVSDRHANFLVAGPEASSSDIRALVEVVKDRVYELSDIMLEPEILFVGFEDGD
jgi:UDP-N-acetylmuramate dehydrogenase